MKTIVATLATVYLSISSVRADITNPAGMYPVKHAEIVSIVKPGFPEFAKRLRMEGYVLVRVQVGRDGKAKQVTVAKSTNPLFEEAAVQSALTAQYMPATMPQGPVTSWVEIPFTFKYPR